MSSADTVKAAKAIILDCQGTTLTAEETALFRDYNPQGFILFQRSCEAPDQLRRLTDQLREAVGRPDVPILIDQEGGTVARLKSPAFREFPSARIFKDWAAHSPDQARRAVFLNALMMAEQLADLGITVNCTPVLDLPVPGSHEFLAGSRVYGETVGQVSNLGAEICQAHLQQGVTPVIKHIPGHGRATVDSHYNLPRIDASLEDLRRQDFRPFAEMAQQSWGRGLWAMTAHVVYNHIDGDLPGSLSAKVIEDIIRTEIGFDGVLIADDISMKALQGDMPDLAKETLAAGCDLTLICNQDFQTREAVLKATPEVTELTQKRLTAAEDIRQSAKKQVNIEAVSEEYDKLISGLAVS
ncbi:MAG: beta-N-acetylhexosaminidase [Pseudomonadota bacterium]